LTGFHETQYGLGMNVVLLEIIHVRNFLPSIYQDDNFTNFSRGILKLCVVIKNK